MKSHLETGSGIVTAGVLTAGSLSKALKKAGVHPRMIEHMHGSGFFSNLVNAVTKGTKFILDNKDQIAGVAKGAKGLYDTYQKSKSGGALKQTKRAPTQRALLIKRLMKTNGMSMIQASQYIKSNNLY